MKLLFLGGISLDLWTLASIATIIFLIGVVIFYISRFILRKTRKKSTPQQITRYSRILAIVLAPLIFVLSIVVVVYLLIRSEGSYEPTQAELQEIYEITGQDLERDLVVGMTKEDVYMLFPVEDSTQSTWSYDLTYRGAEEKYIVEMTFENGKLSGYKRKE